MVEARHLPITNMIDNIRYKTMIDLAEKSRLCKKWSGRLCPKQEKRLQEALNIGCTWTVVAAGNDILRLIVIHLLL